MHCLNKFTIASKYNIYYIKFMFIPKIYSVEN